MKTNKLFLVAIAVFLSVCGLAMDGPQPQYDEHGNVYYLDQFGDRYYTDEFGTIYYLDQSGIKFYYDEDGQAHYFNEQVTDVTAGETQAKIDHQETHAPYNPYNEFSADDIIQVRDDRLTVSVQQNPYDLSEQNSYRLFWICPKLGCSAENYDRVDFHVVQNMQEKPFELKCASCQNPNKFFQLEVKDWTCHECVIVNSVLVEAENINLDLKCEACLTKKEIAAVNAIERYITLNPKHSDKVFVAKQFINEKGTLKSINTRNSPWLKGDNIDLFAEVFVETDNQINEILFKADEKVSCKGRGQALAKVIACNRPHLVKMEFQFTDLTEEDIFEIATALKKNNSITHIDFQGNLLGNGTYHLANVLKQNKTIKTLILRGVGLNDVDLGMLIGALTTNTSLTHLDIAGNSQATPFEKGISQPMIKMLEWMIRHENHTLLVVIIGGKELSKDARRALEKNRKEKNQNSPSRPSTNLPSTPRGTPPSSPGYSSGSSSGSVSVESSPEVKEKKVHRRSVGLSMRIIKKKG